jgi:hypothetical protein
MATKECTSVAGHFGGYVNVLKQYTWHHLMQHVQGYIRSHWMPPLGNYSLRIAPAATRATSRQTTMKNTPNLLAILMAMAMRRYVTTHIAQWRRSRATLESTGYCHWASIMSYNIKGTYLHWFLLMFFILNTLKMSAKQKDCSN